MTKTPLYTISFEGSDNEMQDLSEGSDNNNNDGNMVKKQSASNIHPPPKPVQKKRPIATKKGRNCPGRLKTKKPMSHSRPKPKSQNANNEENADNKEMPAKEESSNENQPQEEKIEEESSKENQPEKEETEEESNSENSNPALAIEDVQQDSTIPQNVPTSNPGIENQEEIENLASNFTFRLSSTPKVYLLQRDKRLTRTVIQWSLSYQGEVLYSAKSKGPFNPTIVLQKGPEVHYSSPDPDFVILTSHQRIFDLHEKGKTGKLVGSIIFISNFEDSMRPRSLTLETNSPNLKLHNLEPVFNSHKNSWQLNFNGKFTLRSIKNVILQDDLNRTCIICRKFSENSLEIESYIENYPDYYIAALAIADFLCTVE